MTRCNTLFLAAVLGLTACVAQPPQPGAKNAEEVAASHCMRDTGTRVPLPEGRCSANVGQSISGEDLTRNGDASIYEAIDRIGP